MSNGNGHRWSKFWWQDHQGDAALRSCSLAARGYWVEMLCVMHGASPVGHLLLNGRQPTHRQMASIAGCSERESKALSDELELAGVFSRTPDGTIYCRRMTRDAAASEEGRKWGKEGGNPALRGGLTPPDKPTHGGRVNGEDNQPPYTQKLEAESEAERPPRSPPVNGGERRPKRKRRESRYGFANLEREAQGPPVIDGKAEDVELVDKFLVVYRGGKPNA